MFSTPETVIGMRLRAAGALIVMVLCGGLLCPPVAGAVCLSVPACLEATFPPDHAWGALDPGPSGNQSEEQVITVTSNQTGGIRIASDLADGRMKEWTGSAYVNVAPKVLGNPLEWSLTRVDAIAQPVDYRPLSATAAVVVSNRPSTCLLVCATAQVAVSYRQVVSFGDPSAGANDYRIGVTYEAGQGF